MTTESESAAAPERAHAGHADVLERAQAAVATIAGGLDDLHAIDTHELAGADAADVLVAVEALARRLDAIRTALLLAVDASGMWALDGSRSLSAWFRRATGSSAQEAFRTVRTAKALRDHLPLTSAALAEGELTTEHARLLATHTTKTPERIEALTSPVVGEQFLVDQARQLDAGDFAKVLRAWAIAADPSGADGAYAEDADRQELVLAKALHGYHVQGWLTDADGAALEAALAAVIGVPDADDKRSVAQRRATALVTLARLALDSGTLMPGAAIRPHLTVHVQHETLLALAAAQSGPTPADATPGAAAREPASSDTAASDTAASDTAPQPDGAPSSTAGDSARPSDATTPVDEPYAEAGRFGWPRTAGRALGSPEHIVIPGELDHAALVGAVPAELDDHTPIAPALLARLACDSELARVIFGPTSEVLDVGRTRRLFTPAQRRAVIARDRRCTFPGCDSPPAFGEIHHSIWWYTQHGHTRVDDGVLLCWGHHDYVHAHRITIKRDSAAGPKGSRGWVFIRSNGSIIGTDRGGAASSGRSRESETPHGADPP